MKLRQARKILTQVMLGAVPTKHPRALRAARRMSRAPYLAGIYGARGEATARHNMDRNLVANCQPAQAAASEALARAGCVYRGVP